MVLLELSALITLIFIPWNALLLCIVALAAIGKSLGVRRLYIKILLYIFEFGRKSIEAANRRKHRRILARQDSDEDEGFEEGAPSKIENEPIINRTVVNNNETSLISREKDLILVPEPAGETSQNHNDKEEKINFDIKHWLKTFDFVKSGIEAIIEDEVTSRFEIQELKNWNLLTRTNCNYEFISFKLTVLWIVGFFFRYFFLLPLRIYIFLFGISWLCLSTTIIGNLPDSALKRWLNHRCYVTAHRILTRSLSAVITFHNKEFRPKKGSICVANHTSPIDAIVLSNDNCYSLIGQKHGGLIGIIQKTLHQASPHIWFQRSETKDRGFVLRRMKEHAANPNSPPILIFPEGTCINNTSVMQFKKGSFEVDCPIYPVAIKYDPIFGNAFWNSSKYSMVQYLYTMMTSWAIVCDVWYLPPVCRKERESSVDFANRVKHLIAEQGGLVDLVWDGQLKRSRPKKEWIEKQQMKFSKVWKYD